jgi:hypothetical protein
VTPERRYDDDEVRQIFGWAAESPEPSLPAGAPGTGLTLSELQEIGREVGLSPQRIAAAAAQLDVTGELVRDTTYLGLPISVGHSVELPRPLTAHEWEVLVGEIRETFGARGQVTATGGLREWTNGNLQVFLETTETGHRLRLRTTKGSAMNATWMGVTLLVLAVVLLGVLLLTGQPEDLAISALLGALGAAALGSNALVLPPWARERQGQMRYIAGRALTLTASEPEA